MNHTPTDPLNVLSLFNGMGCIWLALDQLGIPVGRRYSSEINTSAIKVNDDNYPDTTQLGDVTKVNASELERIDLLVAGSPCQGFSQAGGRLNFNDPRSKLFFEFVRLLDESKPKYFMLENVSMKKEQQDVISKYLGCEPIKLNSNLLTAQSRSRLYWTNLPVQERILDKGIVVADILESGPTPINLLASPARVFHPVTPGRRSPTGLKLLGGLVGPNETMRTHTQPVGSGNFRTQQRLYCVSGKAACLTLTERTLYATNTGNRKLTRVELERLQGVPDNYTRSVSRGVAMKMLGNGWTVPIVAHVLSGLSELHCDPNFWMRFINEPL